MALIINGYNQWKWHLVHVELTVVKRGVRITNALVELKCNQICCDHPIHLSFFDQTQAMNTENGPKSMPQGARNIIRSNDSPSLWNLTLSPGWTDQESEALRLAVMKFGIGNWAKIRECQVLPYKTNAQLNLQLQRLLGQQSTAEFAGLHIDPKVIGAKNAKIQGPNIRRKNNCIVNTGNALTKEELKAKVLHNKQHYEIPESEWSTIKLPNIENVGVFAHSLYTGH